MDKKNALAAMRTEYDRLDRLCGVNTQKIELKLSGRLTRRLGYFTVSKKNLLTPPELSITVATRILQSDALFYEVIRHEYAHALVYLRKPREKHGHDTVWRAAAREVGCNPRATTKVEDYGIPADGGDRPDKKSGKAAGKLGRTQSKKAAYKYALRCCTCGAESRFKTECKTVMIAEGKLPGSVICRRCRGRAFSCYRLR